MKAWTLSVLLVSSVSIADNKPAPKRPPPAAGYTGLGAESVTAQEIAKYLAPPLPDTVTRKIQAMIDVRGAGGGIITSKGDRMVFGSRLTGTNQIFRQDGPMKYPIQLTGGEDRTAPVAITPDDKWVVVSRDIGGQENPGLYLMSIEGGPLKVVQHTPKVQTALEFVSDDSKYLYFRSNDIAPDSYAIYRYEIASGKRDLMFDQKGLWSIADEKGDQWLMTKALGSDQIEVFQYDTKSKQLTPLLGQNEREDYDVQFGAKAGQVLVLSNKLSDVKRIYTLEGGKLTPITPELKFDIDGFGIDQQRQRIYYTVNENGFYKSAVIDAKAFKPIALPKLADADNTTLGGVSRNGRFVQLNIDGSTMAPQNVVYDWQARKLTTWRVPMTPELDPKTFTKHTLETYPARDGTKIPMFVWRAKCTGPCPVVVEFHGGPEGQSTAGFNPRAQLWVDAGFTFVQPNVRGSTGYGKAWLHADDGPKRLSVVTDIEDVAKYIRSTWAVGGKAPKVGVTGGSYGGYATLMAMTMFAGAYDAGVSNVGISNLTTFLMNTAPYRRILRISEYGDPEKDREALVKLSPTTHINKIKSPLMIIQGVNDPRVPVGEAMQMYKELERRRIPGGLILFPDEGHGAAKRGNQVLTIGHTIAFMEKHLR
jgi:dipeptidyl aminopeptidase/acylaminoacyl peptidase